MRALSTLAAVPPVDALGGHTMGTTWSVKLVAPRKTDLHALHTQIQAQLDCVVAQMSNWEPDSDISRYNAADANTWHALPDRFWIVLRCALDIAHASDGAYDPTIGPLVDAWGFGPAGRRSDAPPVTTLADARRRVGWRRITLRADGQRALQPGGIRLDLCAIAKGYAVDAVAARLQSCGIDSALVEVGGELYGYGRKPDGQPWRVIVEAWAGDEHDEREARVLALDRLAIATSGDRWQHHESDGRIYSHTIDPRSGTPVQDAPSAVTVVGDDAMHADGWATALAVLGFDDGYRLACERGLAARFIGASTTGFAERITPAFAALLAA